MTTLHFSESRGGDPESGLATVSRPVVATTCLLPLVVTVIAAVERSDALAATKLSLRFQVLTAARPGAVREARWSDIDLLKRVWTIPAEGMKGAKEHAGAACLSSPRNPRRSPSSRGRERPRLSFRERRHALERYPFEARPGARVQGGSPWVSFKFRNWCAMNAVPREVAEACLAHRGR